MENQQDTDLRKHNRLDASFIISYRIKEIPKTYDLAQTKNVSQGGLLLTTNRSFDLGTVLAITMRFPFSPTKIELVGEVIDSKEIVKELIYDTRIQFSDLDEEIFQDLGSFIANRLKQGYRDTQ